MSHGSRSIKWIASHRALHTERIDISIWSHYDRGYWFKIGWDEIWPSKSPLALFSTSSHSILMMRRMIRGHWEGLIILPSCVYVFGSMGELEGEAMMMQEARQRINCAFRGSRIITFDEWGFFRWAMVIIIPQANRQKESQCPFPTKKDYDPCNFHGQSWPMAQVQFTHKHTHRSKGYYAGEKRQATSWIIERGRKEWKKRDRNWKLN